MADAAPAAAAAARDDQENAEPTSIKAMFEEGVKGISVAR